MSLRTASWVGLVLDGRYRVTGKLGEGGMADIYKARDTRLDCDVVLKVPQAVLLRDPAFARRFTHEVRSLVRLTHPHVVKISDAGVHEGTPFAVMQFLPGGSLGDRRGSAAGQPALALGAWLEGVAAALDFIHTQHFVHRDVKPENILFDEHGHVYLSDFGIAKALGDGRSQGQRTVLTNPGAVQGTLPYMAPELIVGQPYDGRVDQFGLAVTVYELLSGRFPFSGETPTAVYEQQKIPPLPLAALVSGVPEALSAAVQQALTRDPKQRYASCRAFSDAVLQELGAPQRGSARAAWSPGERARPETPLTLACPGCQKTYDVPATALGKRLRCPSCQAAFRAPDAMRPTHPVGVTPLTSQAPPLSGQKPPQPGPERQRPSRLILKSILGALVGAGIAGLLIPLGERINFYNDSQWGEILIASLLVAGGLSGIIAGWQASLHDSQKHKHFFLMLGGAVIGAFAGLLSAHLGMRNYVPYGIFLGDMFFGGAVGLMFGWGGTLEKRGCVGGLIVGIIVGECLGIASTCCSYMAHLFAMPIMGAVFGAAWGLANSRLNNIQRKTHDIVAGAAIVGVLFIIAIGTLPLAYNDAVIAMKPIADCHVELKKEIHIGVDVDAYHSEYPISLHLESVPNGLIIIEGPARHWGHSHYSATLKILARSGSGGSVRLVATAGSLKTERLFYVTVAPDPDDRRK